MAQWFIDRTGVGIHDEFGWAGVERTQIDALELSLDRSAIKQEVVAIRQEPGESMSILKNFDYYQYLICKMLPEIADTNPFKKVFQKIRFVIICSFAKFISLLDTKDYVTITKWNILSKKNLELVAEMVNSYRQGIEFSNISNGFKFEDEICIFFNLNIDKIDEELNRYYL